MRFSQLQKYTLCQALAHKDKLERRKLFEYYKNKNNEPSRTDQLNIITKSCERLIDKGLLVGYGRRTAEKWFFTYFRLTAKGRKKALEIRKQKQQKLPFKK